MDAYKAKQYLVNATLYNRVVANKPMDEVQNDRDAVFRQRSVPVQ